MKKIFYGLLLGLSGIGLANAQSAQVADKTAAEIRACSSANLPEKSMVQALDISINERSGNTREIEASIFLKRFKEQESRGTLQVSQPADVRGVSYLWVDTGANDQLFLYLPSLQRVRRITGETAANSLLGSDFSYEDIKHLRGVSAGGSEQKLESAQIAERPVYRLQVTPAPSEGAVYDHLLFYIDRETCVPLQIEFFAESESEMPRKRLTADVDSLQKFGERWLARRINMHDLDEGTETSMTITGVEFDEHVNDAIFNRRGFYLSAYVKKTEIQSDLNIAPEALPDNPE